MLPTRLGKRGERPGWRRSVLDITCVLMRTDALQSNENNERGRRGNDKPDDYCIFKSWSKRRRSDDSDGRIEKYGCISAGCYSCASAHQLT